MTFQIINILFSAIALVAVGSLIFLWCFALYQVLVRKDLQESRVLWILLLVFVAPIGSIAYFFTEKKSKFGIWTVLSIVALVFVLPLYAIVAFIAAQS